MPINMTGTARPQLGDVTHNGNRLFLSYLVSILPFVEQQALWEQISNPNTNVTPGATMPGAVTGGRWPAMGPCPWVPQYPAWVTEVAAFRCPSDPAVLGGVPFGRTNYGACQGDAIDTAFYGGRNEVGVYQTPGWLSPATNNFVPTTNDHEVRARGANRGFFWSRHKIGFEDVLDGLSNTVAAGELCSSLGVREIRADWVRNITVQGTGSFHGAGQPILCDRGAHINQTEPLFYASGANVPIGGFDSPRGCRWADGRPTYSAVQTILPPNRPSCSRSTSDGNDQFISSMGSRHQGGAHVLMGDGAVRFVTDSIESGDPSRNAVVASFTGHPTNPNMAGAESPYGLWGSLGTRASSEVIKSDF